MERPVYTAGGTPEMWDWIPDHMWDGMREWIENGVPQGDFLMAVLSNDLKEACGRADNINQRRLFQYCQFLYNAAPSACWGSPEQVAWWRERKGLRGIENA